jgi:hypothetical protein
VSKCAHGARLLAISGFSCHDRTRKKVPEQRSCLRMVSELRNVKVAVGFIAWSFNLPRSSNPRPARLPPSPAGFFGKSKRQKLPTWISFEGPTNFGNKPESLKVGIRSFTNSPNKRCETRISPRRYAHLTVSRWIRTAPFVSAKGGFARTIPIALGMTSWAACAGPGCRASAIGLTSRT